MAEESYDTWRERERQSEREYSSLRVGLEWAECDFDAELEAINKALGRMDVISNHICVLLHRHEEQSRMASVCGTLLQTIRDGKRVPLYEALTAMAEAVEVLAICEKLREQEWKNQDKASDPVA